MKRIIVSLFISLSLMVSVPAKADSLLGLIDLTYGVGKLVVYSAAAGVMFVGGAAIKGSFSVRKRRKMIVEAPNTNLSIHCLPIRLGETKN
jgi:hypothetical protein